MWCGVNVYCTGVSMSPPVRVPVRRPPGRGAPSAVGVAGSDFCRNTDLLDLWRRLSFSLSPIGSSDRIHPWKQSGGLEDGFSAPSTKRETDGERDGERGKRPDHPNRAGAVEAA